MPDDQLVTANAVGSQAQNLARLAGSGLGGVIAAAGGSPPLPWPTRRAS